MSIIYEKSLAFIIRLAPLPLSKSGNVTALPSGAAHIFGGIANGPDSRKANWSCNGTDAIRIKEEKKKRGGGETTTRNHPVYPPQCAAHDSVLYRCEFREARSTQLCANAGAFLVTSDPSHTNWVATFSGRKARGHTCRALLRS